MSGRQQNQEYGLQGGQITLDIYFYNKQDGDLVDDDNFISNGTLPTINIFEPNSYITPITTGSAVRLSVGHYEYTYTIAADAEISDGWKIQWNVTINNKSKQFEEYFRVESAGYSLPESKRDIPDTDNITKLRKRIYDWKAGQDTQWVFYNSELQEYIDSAISEHSAAEYDESTLPAADTAAILILSHAMVCEALATDKSKYFSYTEGQSGDSVDKSMTPDMFLKLAKHFRATYATNRSKKTDEKQETIKAASAGGYIQSPTAFFKAANTENYKSVT